MLYPIIILGSIVTGYYYKDFTSLLSDKLCGYITITCSNKSCNKKYKLLKNDMIDITQKYYCNTLCEYITNNNEQEDFIKTYKFVC
jgi:hypothetical protein